MICLLKGFQIYLLPNLLELGSWWSIKSIGPQVVLIILKNDLIVLAKSFFFQVGSLYMCTRLVVNLSQTYLPMFLTDSLLLDKVCFYDFRVKV